MIATSQNVNVMDKCLTVEPTIMYLEISGAVIWWSGAVWCQLYMYL